MKSFDLFTDATVDLSKAAFQSIDLTVIPMRYFVGDETFVHTPGPNQMSGQRFYAMLKAGADVTTSTVSPDEFVTHFTPSLQAGRDVLYIGVSNALSGTFGFSLAAAELLREQFPGRRILCIDSLAAAAAQGLLLLYADRLRAEGKHVDQVAEAVQDAVLHTAVYLAVEDLGALRKSGRISGLVATASSALGIRPILRLDSEGRLGLGGTARGKAKCMKFMVEQIKKNYRPRPSSTIFVLHTNCEDDAKEFAEIIRAQIPGCETELAEVGPIIGTHVGSGVLAACYCCIAR